MSFLPFRLGFCLLLALGIARAPAAAQPLSEGAVPPKTRGSIGVAPFERAGANRGGQPDVAALLAQRLGTRGVERVVGPDELSVDALADPRASTVADWADRAGVHAVVVGRTTRIGERLIVDARLRGGESGERLGSPFFAEVARPEDLESAVEALAGEVLQRFAHAPAPTPAVSAPAPRSSEPYRRDAPFEIRSDELEAADTDGRKRLLFLGNVRADQGALALRAQRLEAFYPRGRSQPDRLIAQGQVVIHQGERRAYCDRAELLRAEDRVVCRGNARLEEGCDRVRGREIVFHLDREVLKVNGAADVRIHPRGAACEGGT